MIDVHCLLVLMTTWIHTSFPPLQLSALSAMRHTEETGEPRLLPGTGAAAQA